MDDNVLLVEEDAGVVTLTLNRPEVMNSFNFSLLHALRDQIESFRFRKDLRVIIITGSGEKAFCSGADLKERATLSPDQVKEYIFTIRNLFTSIEQLNKAFIAAVNGIALGGGTELALASDIRIASSTANMGLTETRWPVKISSFAFPLPTSRGKRWVPPAPGIIARRVSVSPILAVDEAMRISLANASSVPPPSAIPLTAAITALFNSSMEVKRFRIV
jgi:hypothetical protein